MEVSDVEPFLLRLAERDLRVLVKELFLAELYLRSLQVGVGIALQGLITQVSSACERARGA